MFSIIILEWQTLILATLLVVRGCTIMRLPRNGLEVLQHQVHSGEALSSLPWCRRFLLTATRLPRTHTAKPQATQLMPCLPYGCASLSVVSHHIAGHGAAACACPRCAVPQLLFCDLVHLHRRTAHRFDACSARSHSRPTHVLCAYYVRHLRLRQPTHLHGLQVQRAAAM
jgi:hypothetical protein